jgi:hypothetical protein
MAYVAKDDIILYSDGEYNFIQGGNQSYTLTLYKDFIGNALNLNEPTSFHVAVYSDDVKYLQYSYPHYTGVSANLDVDITGNTGNISFTIDPSQSGSIAAGDLFVEVTVIYENFYPRSKSYVFPRLLIGEAIQDPNNNTGGGDTGGGDNGGGDNGGGDNGNTGSNTISTANGIFTIEHIDGQNPSAAGFASVDDSLPGAVNSIIFRNLNTDGIRLTSLENFLTKRITNEEINGIMTIIDTDPTNMYAIYKIESWERVDITTGGGDDQDSDGIKINLSLEANSTGPGVTKSSWSVGQKITFNLDAHGITSSESLPDGILTYVDKNINPTATSGDNQSTGVLVSYSPYQDSYVMVEVNGISVNVGNGTKDTDSYFSGDGGNTPTTIEEIRAGDELYWNASYAGYDLEIGDEINLIYEAKSDDLR